MRSVSTAVRIASIASVVSLAAVGPAFAIIIGPVGVPGPTIGAGVPALAVFGVGYWLIRRRRRR